jgi:uncharacterized membrane protein YphA (DoxX/SURF4 family)
VRRYALALIRVAVGAVFLVTGSAKFARHAAEVKDFRHWGLPSPDLFVYAVGVVELLFGLLLLTGLATRLAALVLLVDMLGAVATAGRVDHGAHLVVPPVLALLCLVLAARGGGAWQLVDRIDPPPQTARR